MSDSVIAFTSTMNRILALICFFPCAAMAQDLVLPGNAVITHQNATAPDTQQIAIGRWENGSMEHVIAAGGVTQSAWKISVAGLTTLQVLQPVREQLLADGFTELFTCEDSACGGFDFRFALDVLLPPDMQVNLANFRYWSGQKTGANGPEYIALLISQIAGAAYVQIDRVRRADDQGRIMTDGRDLTASGIVPSEDMIAGLNAIGRAVLDDLRFAPGAATLGDADYGSLRRLATFLKDHPTLQVAIVGHTDSAGGLQGNIALSQQRARAVRQRLINRHAIPASQLTAEGMGYLSPVESNLTQAGRTANRRVEAVVISTAQD